MKPVVSLSAGALISIALTSSFVSTVHAGTTTASSNANASVQSGTFQIAAAPSVAFPATTLTGDAQTVSSSSVGGIQVVDARGSGPGWHLQVESTVLQETAPSGGFVTGTSAISLPAGSLQLTTSYTSGAITPYSVTGGTATTSTAPTWSTASSAQSIDAGSAVTIASAAKGAGMGGFQLTMPANSFQLALDPATITVDTTNYPTSATPYSTTMTWTLSTGP